MRKVGGRILRIRFRDKQADALQMLSEQLDMSVTAIVRGLVGLGVDQLINMIENEDDLPAGDFDAWMLRFYENS